MVPFVWYIWRMVVNGSSQGGGCGKTRKREKRAAKGWIERRWTVGRWRDEREDSITRHRQPRAYLVAIGFSLPKASSALYRIVHSASPRETHQDRTSFWNSVSWLSGWRWTSSYCLDNSDRTRIRDASKFLVQLLTQWLFEKKYVDGIFSVCISSFLFLRVVSFEEDLQNIWSREEILGKTYVCKWSIEEYLELDNLKNICSLYCYNFLYYIDHLY